MMRKAFTLMEMVVALGILAVVMAFAGAIFRVSVGTQRLALANGEIMQKLRIITEQLDTDFRGIAVQYGGGIRSQDEAIGSSGKLTHADSIVFFANGDFQSTQQYGSTTSRRTVVGNAAAIFYGPFDLSLYRTRGVLPPPPQERVLLRRQTILSPDASLPASTWDGEYYPTSLEQCRLAPPYGSVDTWLKRPVFDPDKLDNVQVYQPLYLAKGVDNFTISYLRGGTPLQAGSIPWYRSVADQNTPTMISPRAIKFEFTLYDSRGIIKQGRKFSHIVMVDR